MSVSYRTYEPATHRRRRWPIVLPLALVIVLAAGWSGVWFYAAGRAESELAAWRARQAAAGRVVNCSRQDFSGFPFRFELRCAEPSLSLQKARLSLAAKDMLAAVQVYQPSLMIGEFGGPLTVTEEGRGGVAINWSLAQASLRGLPPTPERVSLALDQPTVTPLDGNAPVATATHAELHARAVPRLPQDPPALDVALNLAQALLPGLARVPNVPIDADVAGTLRGVSSLSPKPWRQLLRDLQVANGELEVRQARIRQGDILGVGRGTLRLTPRGMVDGQLDLTIAGIEQLVTALGIDQKVGQASQNALDRLAPGLNLNKLLGPRGGAAIAAAGAAMLGQPAELEGRRAVTLPLRFADGVVFLGPLRVGEMAPLF
jgi:hypothetical protein